MRSAIAARGSPTPSKARAGSELRTPMMSLEQPIGRDAAAELGREGEEARRVAGAVDDRTRIHARVRCDHLLALTCPQRGRPHLDVLDDAGVVVDGDLIAQAKRAF